MVSRLVDIVLDRSVVLGYSRIGPAVRRRLPGWPADPMRGALAGRHVAVTGATSGLGTATAAGLRALGAHVHLVVRDEALGEETRVELLAGSGTGEVSVHRCDVGDLDDVRRFSAAFRTAVPGLDVLVHNAGVMPTTRTQSVQGHELTMAVHVLGPVLMTELLLPVLGAAQEGARVVLVTSGGMYAQALPDDDPEYLDGEYSGTTAYARSKRVQCELLPVLQQRWHDHGVDVHATHPGWAATPGVAESLPGFDKVMGPLLRTTEDGADTTVWLAAVQPPRPGGHLWHDRKQRPLHWLGRNRPRRGGVRRMWEWVRSQSGLAEHP